MVRRFGGNSGYVGYSKSKRAVNAENRGLKSISNMDIEFKNSVNDILLDNGCEEVSLSYIKKVAKDTSADEWHHTSMYGNRTYYYSAQTIADRILELLEEEKDRASKTDNDIQKIIDIYEKRMEDMTSIYISSQDFSICFNGQPLNIDKWSIVRYSYDEYGNHNKKEPLEISKVQLSQSERIAVNDTLKFNREISKQTLEEWLNENDKYLRLFNVSLQDVLKAHSVNEMMTHLRHAINEAIKCEIVHHDIF